MSKSLLIVESPSKAKTIQQYLSKQYHVLASYGHVRDLIPKTGAVDPEHDFEMKYDTIERNAKHVDKIIQAAKKVDQVLLATDPDREGEAIAWHVAHLIHAQKKLAKIPCKRVIFHQITKRAILQAVEAPRDISMPLVNAQQARRALDYLVGFNLSPLLWKKIRRGLSAGRVQSPALKMIVERELEIRAFKSEEYWTINSKHEESQIEFQGKLTHYNGEKLEPLSIKNEAQATEMTTAIKKFSSLKASSVVKKERKRNPPPPYTTSTLQQDAVRKLGFTASRTMRVAQQLYEGIDIDQEHVGLITYMRTDSVNIATELFPIMRQYIEKEYGKDFLPDSPRVFKTKTKNAQEAHEAIRPTDFNRKPSQLQHMLSPEQFKMYQMIWQRGLASQMASAIMDTVGVDLVADQVAVFRANGSSVKHPGYLKVYQEGQDDNKVSALEEKNLLPEIKEGQSIEVNAILQDQHFTEPPPRYNEATLVKSLEEKGIGRPSTYASIISTLQDREYVEKNDNKRFEPTDVGEIVNKFLDNHFTQYVEYDFTAKLEDQLDAIARGEGEWKPLMAEFWQPFHKQIDSVGENVQRSDVTEEKMDEKCPKCEAQLVTKLGKRGRFVGCSKYPDCDYTRNLDGEEEPETPELVGRECPKCEADLVYKFGRYGKFIGCSRYPDCKHIESLKVSEDTGVTCPKCKENHLMKKLTRRGKIFFGCKGYPKCQYALWHTPIESACPECKWPITMEQITKKEGKKIVCPECKHVISTES